MIIEEAPSTNQTLRRNLTYQKQPHLTHPKNRQTQKSQKNETKIDITEKIPPITSKNKDKWTQVKQILVNEQIDIHCAVNKRDDMQVFPKTSTYYRKLTKTLKE